MNEYEFSKKFEEVYAKEFVKGFDMGELKRKMSIQGDTDGLISFLMQLTHDIVKAELKAFICEE